MDIIKFLYNIIALLIITLGCESAYVKLKRWARQKNEDGKTLLKPRNVQYFDVLVAIILVFLCILLLNRSAWMEGPFELPTN